MAAFLSKTEAVEESKDDAVPATDVMAAFLSKSNDIKES
jgi:hypothetical protein